MLLIDLTHTSHTRAQTGIQRVCRELHGALAVRGAVTPVCLDPYLRGWRPLDRAEVANLRPSGAAGKSRGAHWPLHRRVAGHLRRLAGRRTAPPAGDGLVCPELFSAGVGAALPRLFAGVAGPRVAVFHDALGLRLPEMTPARTVARLPAYLRELLQFDGVAAVSEDSAASLRDFWAWLGEVNPPPVTAIPLGITPIPAPGADEPAATSGPPRVLCLGTLEGRKNHLALLEASESLWAAGVVFELELIGMARADTAGAALQRIRDLQARGRPLTWHGAVADESVHRAFRRSAFTVYPSLMEGFGLPVLESLQHGKPCVCSDGGALGESARDGGCVTLPEMTAPAIAAAMRRLLGQPAEVAALAAAARRRKFRTWTDYARDLAAWMGGLQRR